MPAAAIEITIEIPITIESPMDPLHRYTPADVVSATARYTNAIGVRAAAGKFAQGA